MKSHTRARRSFAPVNHGTDEEGEKALVSRYARKRPTCALVV